MARTSGHCADPKCWTKETDHCSRCGEKFLPGETAGQHKRMLQLHGVAPVWHDRHIHAGIRDEWELFTVATGARA